MVRCCTAVVEMALHSGWAGNGDSRWSLGRKGEMKLSPSTNAFKPRKLYCGQNQIISELNDEPLHAVVEKEAGRGPLGLTEGRGGMVELALLLGADLE